jgi:hypothetical protein
VNDYSHREDPKARELGIWENEGGAPAELEGRSTTASI